MAEPDELAEVFGEIPPLCPDGIVVGRVLGVLPSFWFMFDVEAIGLDGEAFSVGWCVTDPDGVEVESGWTGCSPVDARGTQRNYEWVVTHVPSKLPTCETPIGVRRGFVHVWDRWRERGATAIADCGWPVEARFLHEVKREWPEWKQPYPLHELGSILLLAGIDPTRAYPRRPSEEPVHDPMRDAMQSSRLLHEALRAMRGAPHG